MKKLLLVSILSILLSSCLPIETVTPEVTIIPVVSETPTSTPTLTPTATAPSILMNKLLCSGFECGEYLQPDRWGNLDGDLRLAKDWKLGWTNSVPQNLSNNLTHECTTFKPHAELETYTPHVLEGRFSQRVIQAYSACPSYLYQTVKTVPGAVNYLSANVLLWSTDKPIVDTPSTADMAAYICVNLSGSIEPFTADFLCSKPAWNSLELANKITDQFKTLTFSFTSKTDKVTIFLLNLPNFAVARSDAFWDIALLMTAMEAPTSVPIDNTPLITPTPIIPVPSVFSGIGTMLYKSDTNLRDCRNTAWVNPFDPTTTCNLMKQSDGSNIIIPNGAAIRVQKWELDQYGNLWAWMYGLTSVACYKDAPHGDFYLGLEPDTVMKGINLPIPVNPCTMR